MLYNEGYHVSLTFLNNMGGIVSKETVPSSNSGTPGLPSKRGSSRLLGIPAGSLDANAKCFELKHLVPRLRVYQHYESGEIMLLVNEDLSDTTPGVVDATEWVQVFLNSQNEQYLEQTT